jgi:hypothetical protein
MIAGPCALPPTIFGIAGPSAARIPAKSRSYCPASSTGRIALPFGRRIAERTALRLHASCTVPDAMAARGPRSFWTRAPRLPSIPGEGRGFAGQS